jgi:hypothetical protein
MTELLRTILLPVAVGIVTLWIGLYLKERTRIRREERAAIGQALTTLLLVRRRLYAVQTMAKQLNSVLSIPPRDFSVLEHVVTAFLPDFKGMDADYERATKYISGIRPMLALRLNLDKTRLNLKKLSALALSTGAPPAWWETIKEITQPESLDESIRELSKLHGRGTAADVAAFLDGEDQISPELQEKIDSLISPLRP